MAKTYRRIDDETLEITNTTVRQRKKSDMLADKKRVEEELTVINAGLDVLN